MPTFTCCRNYNILFDVGNQTTEPDENAPKSQTSGDNNERSLAASDSSSKSSSKRKREC